MYDCDWMYDNDGILKIIELNPRMSGSIAVPVIAGANYLDNIISLSKLLLSIWPKIVLTQVFPLLG